MGDASAPGPVTNAGERTTPNIIKCDCGRSLKEHLVTIHGEDPYIEHLCPICNFEQPKPLIGGINVIEGANITLTVIDDAVGGSSGHFITTSADTMMEWRKLVGSGNKNDDAMDAFSLLPKTPWTADKIDIGGETIDIITTNKIGDDYAYLIEKGTATVEDGSKPS